MLIRSVICPPAERKRLSEALVAFYGSSHDYFDAAERAGKRSWLEPLRQSLAIARANSGRKKLSVLEFGAGRTEFPNLLGADRKDIYYVSQDVTSINVESLARNVDAHHNGALETVQGSFDVVFSTFVIEHLVDPESIFTNVERLLRPGGCHLVICPRYDLPAYVCPSARRNGRVQALRYFGAIVSQHVRRLVTREPGFLINTNPAVLRGDWFRDADAIHIVSKFDLVLWHRVKGFRQIAIEPTSLTWPQRFMREMMICCLLFEKPR